MFLGPITSIRKQKMRESIKYEKNIQRLKTLYSSTLEPVTMPSRLSDSFFVKKGNFDLFCGGSLQKVKSQ